MSFQAYLDNIQSKTGKTPNEFIAMATNKKLTHASGTLILDGTSTNARARSRPGPSACGET